MIDTCQVIAHRGASADRPENTVDAFVEAGRQGADGVELDVRPTSDRRLVVCHDVAFADGRAVSATAFDDVPAGICDLRRALEACGTMLVNVEIKNGEGEPGFDRSGWLAEETLRVISEVSPPGGVLVSSFDPDILDTVRGLPDAPPTGLLVLSADQPRDALAAAADAGHEAVHPWDGSVDEDLVARARDARLALNVWTVDDPGRVRELARWGVDAIITNRPASTRAAIGGGRESTAVD